MTGFLRLLRQIISWAIILFIVLLVVSFALKNQQTVTLTYYFDVNYQVPLWLLVVISIGLGLLLGIIVSGTWLLRAKQQAAAERRKARKFEREVTNLRSLPVKDEI